MMFHDDLVVNKNIKIELIGFYVFKKYFFFVLASITALVGLQWRRTLQQHIIEQYFPLSFIKNTLACFLFILLCIPNSKAQNYFANSDFETLNNCTEYHQDCAPEAWYYLKPAITPLINYQDVPRPLDGKDLMILPIENVFNKITKRSFVYTMLCCPLKAGNSYKLSFYINTRGNTFYGLDFYFSNQEFVSSNFKSDSISPSVHIASDDIENELKGWNYIEKTYKATGKEKFCYIGNFSKTGFDFDIGQRMNKAGDVFYFMDNIALAPLNEEKICVQYQKNIDQLYDQNLRHTESVLSQNHKDFITDTLIIPSVYFENDKAIIKPAFKKTLQKLTNKVAKKNIVAVDIEGHTDSNGSNDRNNILSLQRANAVKIFFVEKIPSAKDIITTVGKSSLNPIADNATTIGRAKNRRVQIMITYEP